MEFSLIENLWKNWKGAFSSMGNRKAKNTGRESRRASRFLLTALLLTCLLLSSVSVWAAQPTGYYVKASDLVPVYGNTSAVQKSSKSTRGCPYDRPSKPLNYDSYHYPAIKKGDEGVKWLQWQLRDHGLLQRQHRRLLRRSDRACGPRVPGRPWPDSGRPGLHPDLQQPGTLK